MSFCIYLIDQFLISLCNTPLLTRAHDDVIFIAIKMASSCTLDLELHGHLDLPNIVLCMCPIASFLYRPSHCPVYDHLHTVNRMVGSGLLNLFITSS